MAGAAACAAYDESARHGEPRQPLFTFHVTPSHSPSDETFPEVGGTAASGPPGRGFSFRRVLTGSLRLASGEIVARAIAFAAVAVLTRRLGPDAFGAVAFAMAIAGYFAIAVNNGMSEIAARELAGAVPQSSTARLYGAVAGVRIVLALVAWAVLAAVAALLPQSTTVQLLVVLSGLSFLAGAIEATWAYRALERTTAAALILIAGQLVYAVAVIVFISGPSDLVLVPVFQFGAELLVALVGVGALIGLRLPPVDWLRGFRIVKDARHLTATRAVRAFTINFDMVMLGLVATSGEVGLYGASYRVLFLLMAIGAAIGTAFLPSFVRAAEAGSEELRRVTGAGVTVALAVGAPVVVGGALTAPALLRMLFGAPYAPAAPAFRILVLAGGCYFVHSLLTYVFLACHRTRMLAVIHGVAAAVNVGLNLWAIPRYGIVGAASATLVAEALTAGVGLAVVARLFGGLSLRPLLAPLAAAAAMAAGLAVWPEQALPVRILLGAAIYVATLAALAAVPLRAAVREFQRNLSAVD